MLAYLADISACCMYCHVMYVCHAMYDVSVDDDGRSIALGMIAMA